MKPKLHNIVVFSLILVLVSGLYACSDGKGEESKTLNIFTWAEYVPPAVIKDFEDEFGITVNYSTFSTNEEMMSNLRTHKNTYDIVVCSDYIIKLMLEEGGYLAELDWSKIPNKVNIEPALTGALYDPDDEYTIPHAYGCALLVYDKEKIGFDIAGYGDLWDERLKDSVVLLDGARDVIGMALKTFNYSMNETDSERLEIAKEKLLQLKPNITAFNADTPHDSMISGDASVGFMFGSQAMAALDAIPTLSFVYPKEGSYYFIDSYVVAEGAPNSENAHKFLNFILRGDVSAKISSIINYSNANSAAKEFLPEEFVNNKMVNVPSEVLEKSESLVDVGEAAMLYDKIFTELKSN